MNSKKNIIDTLRGADKASVEKLMAEEAKKNEIFAKAMERVSEVNENGFSDTVSGVEHYDRKISMKRMASIAAAAVLCTGGVLGGIKLMKDNKFKNNNNSSNTESTTDITETTREEVPYEITKNAVQHLVDGNFEHFRKFSCDYEVTCTEYDTYNKSEPYTIKGSLKLDNKNYIGWNSMEKTYAQPDHEEYVNARVFEYSYNGYRISTNETYEGDIKNKRYDVSFGGDSEYIDLVYLPYIYSSVWEKLKDTSTWDISGEKNENGRRIVTVEGEYGNDLVTSGPSEFYTADIDAETGVVLYESITNVRGEVTFESKYTNYKFDDEAEAPMSPAEFKQFMLDGGYEKYAHSRYDLDVLDGVSPATTTVAYEPVNTVVTTEAHPVPEELTGDFLRERSLNATHYYDKFSAEWTTSRKTNYGDENGPFYDDCQGTIKIDNTTMTGEYNRTEFGTDGTPYDYTHFYFLNNIYITADDYIGTEYTASHKGAEYKSIDNEFLWWWTKPDRVFFEYYGGFRYICMDNGRKRKNGNVDDIINESEWTINGERYENGRRIASVSFSYEQLHEGQYEPMIITADVDVETGIWLANELYYMTDSGEKGMLHSSFKATNYKFDGEAEAPMTADEVMTYLDENDYGLAQSPVY
ncbi:hypothetical protein [Ruminococcus flavefaciens]|uniref:hypothetical protein n=1 Tax=Ruminococcus flavefaciens TaxID=1265 RepID=UPI000464E265|nr:hypothetical protein [Ruminococcus flavefaciens]